MIDFNFGVKLGRIENEAISTILTWRNDPRVYKWCRQRDQISLPEHERWYVRQDEASDIQMYLIWDDERAVGVCGLTSIDHINRRAEFSLYIAPAFWGDGLGKMALKTLLAHGFRTYGLNRIWGESFDGNPAISMFETIGFIKEGTRRDFYYKNGRFIDAHLYSIGAKHFEQLWGKVCSSLSV